MVAKQPTSEVEELRDQIESLKMEIDDLSRKVLRIPQYQLCALSDCVYVNPFKTHAWRGTASTQVMEVETERNLQNEMKRCFRYKAITLGETLRQCRQVALDHGVDPAKIGVDIRTETPCDTPADQIDQPADGPAELEDSSLPPRIIKLRRKAKKNGWFIEPTEVSHSRNVMKAVCNVN